MEIKNGIGGDVNMDGLNSGMDWWYGWTDGRTTMVVW
jgi:hypothetical protein